MQETQLCAVCICCGSFNLFYCINLLVAGYYFVIPRSIFQYLMLCVIYCNLNESQQDLRMISFCTILKFRHLHQEQHQNPGRRFVRSEGSLSSPPGSLLATDCSKAVVLV